MNFPNIMLFGQKMIYRIIFLIAFLFDTSITAVNAQTDTTLKKLLLINYTAYKGHTVDSLVKVLPVNYTKMAIIPSHRGEYGDVLAVFYANNVNVWIQVKTFKYFKPLLDFSKPVVGQWNANISLFRKETLAFAIVYQGNTCWAGCENDPKSQWERKIKP